MYRITIFLFLAINIFAADFQESVNWLEKEAFRIIRESERTMQDGTAAFPPQVGLGYEAFWLRDYAYTLEGAIDAYSDKELLDAARLFVKSIRDDGAGVDCIKFDGTPIYKPGFGSMGENPVADGSQFTVDVVWHTWKKTGDSLFVREVMADLDRTMEAVPLNPETGLVHIRPEGHDRCPYGFTDTILKQGDVLFASLLYVQACRQMADMAEVAGNPAEKVVWERKAQETISQIHAVFWDEETGLYTAATLSCRQPDIWGSAFAVYLGVADTETALKIASYFKQHYYEIVYRGQLRHLPGGMYWQSVYHTQPDTYQNGAYWATPVGWFVFSLDLVDRDLAEQTVVDMVTDFKIHGACEWTIGDTHKLPHYLASAALPLAGIRAMLERRKGD